MDGDEDNVHSTVNNNKNDAEEEEQVLTIPPPSTHAAYIIEKSNRRATQTKRTTLNNGGARSINHSSPLSTTTTHAFATKNPTLPVLTLRNDGAYSRQQGEIINEGSSDDNHDDDHDDENHDGGVRFTKRQPGFGRDFHDGNERNTIHSDIEPVEPGGNDDAKNDTDETNFESKCKPSSSALESPRSPSKRIRDRHNLKSPSTPLSKRLRNRQSPTPSMSVMPTSQRKRAHTWIHIIPCRGDRVEVDWGDEDGEGPAYMGKIRKRVGRWSFQYTVVYDDGDVKNEDLNNKRWRFEKEERWNDPGELAEMVRNRNDKEFTAKRISRGFEEVRRRKRKSAKARESNRKGCDGGGGDDAV